MTQPVTPPGWYPDAAATGVQWWNGRSWTGQAWQPPPDEELFDVSLLKAGRGPKLRLRGTLMQQLGLSKSDAKALIDSSPCVVATRISKPLADGLIHEIVDMGGNLAEWRSTGMTAGTFLAAARAQQTPTAAQARAPTPAAAPAPPPVQCAGVISVGGSGGIALRSRRGAAAVPPRGPSRRACDARASRQDAARPSLRERRPPLAPAIEQSAVVRIERRRLGPRKAAWLSGPPRRASFPGCVARIG